MVSWAIIAPPPKKISPLSLYKLEIFLISFMRMASLDRFIFFWLSIFKSKFSKFFENISLSRVFFESKRSYLSDIKF